MNSLTEPFTSSAVKDSPALIIKRRLLLLICLLVLGQGGLVTIEEAAAQTTAPAETQTEKSGTGVITGRVVGEDGRPLADTVVYLSRALSSVAGTPLTATTDAEGRFRVSGLEAGLYVAFARMPGFTSPDMPTTDGEANYYRVGDSITLTLIKGGVITGTVRDMNGEPVVAVPVRATRVRDAAGRTLGPRSTGFFPERMTDDRGVYRIYGLPSGTYMVSAGGSQRIMIANAYEGDAQTFFPSSMRDTAAEVPVRSGEETTSIDIRYRGERGHTVSGRVSGFIETKADAGASITLRQVPSGGFEAATFVMMGGKPGFSFNGLSDGEYELAAQQWSGLNDGAASLPRRITIKGADLTGLELVLSPLASISGRIQLDAPPAKENCGDARGGALIETVIHARRDEKIQTEGSSRLPFFSASGSIPTAAGEFAIRNLIAGSYRLNMRLPSDDWYVRSIALPNQAASTSPPTPAKSAQAAKSSPVLNLIALNTGARVTNVHVQIAQDAAGLRGRILSATEGAEGVSLPLNLKAYLVPTERERADDILRYGEAQVASDGTITFKNLAPGRYWIIARPAPENETLERTPRPLAWDANTRAALRQEAGAANTAIEFKSCQKVSDYVLRYAAAK